MNEKITIVSGLPRSGTSMMMRMLEAGGMEVVVDHIREADVDNPRGYFEFEKVKAIPEDASWLAATSGKVFKMISMLLFGLPADHNYMVVFMMRAMPEILASQAKMLKRRGKTEDGPDDERMARMFAKHLVKVEKWIEEQANVAVLYVNYADVIREPLANALRVEGFLGRPLDTRKMAEAVDPSLYRNRT